MRNVSGFLHFFLLFVAMISLTGCNPLASKSSIDSNFKPGLGSSVVKNETAANYYGSGKFGAPLYAVPSGNIVSLSTADLNGDGCVDAVVPLPDLNKVGIYLGNCDGSFQTRTDITATSSPKFVAIKDINGDGKLDIVASNNGGSTVSVFLGAGSGTFSAKTDYTTGTNPRGLLLEDFNGDGINDLAVANTGSNSLSILLGNGSAGVGNGTFAAKNDFATGTAPWEIIAKNFNGDTALDLAVTNNGSASISILLGTGTGSFGAKTDYASAPNPTGIASGDLNADGANDIVIGGSGGSLVSVFIGNTTVGVANGTFAAKVDYTAGSGAWAVVLKDLDGDGALDIVSSQNNGAANVSVLMGNKTVGVANGTFAAKVDSHIATTYSVAMTMADLDNDGKSDILSVGATAPVYFSTMRGLGGTSFLDFGQTQVITNGMQPNGLVVADFNGDGVKDIAASNYNSSTVSILIGNKTAGVGDGTYGAASQYSSGGGTVSRDMLAGDFNEDGALDLIVSSGTTMDRISVMLGNKTAGVANGTFAAGVMYAAGTDTRSITSADFNNDGHLDVAAVNTGSTNITLHLGTGTGTFNAGTALVTPAGPAQVIAKDLNADGKIDLILACSGTAKLCVYMGNGDGTFQARVEYPGTTQISLLVAEDFDRDGKVDIVSVNYMAAGTVSFYRGIGDGTFAAKVDGQTTDAYVQRMKTADLNGDGYLDLVITSNYQGLNVMLGNGDGTFNAKTNYKTTTQGSALAIADVNSDGILDIIATGFLATPFMGPIRINLGK